MKIKGQNKARLNTAWYWMAVVALATALAGCASSERAPRNILDSGYLRYQREVEDLDREYLNKNMTYAEYKERRQQLDSPLSSDNCGRAVFLLIPGRGISYAPLWKKSGIRAAQKQS